MSLVDLLCSPWAILEDRYAELREIYAAHAAGRLDLAAVEARLGRELKSELKAYEVMPGGVARLAVDGVMAPKANMFMRISGGLSTQMLIDQFDSMAEDRNVKAAAIVWDSPGGNVLSVPAAAAALKRLADAKPTVSVVDGIMASAAYWVGSAANAIYIEGPTNLVGSLGVVQRLQWDAASPNSMTLARGRYKVLSANGEAPRPEVIRQQEGQLDYLYSVLVNAVAEHRRTTADAVLEHMADGRVFVGQQAIDAGLVDGFSTAADMLDRLAHEPEAFAKRRTARITVPATAAQAPEPSTSVTPPEGEAHMSTAAPAAPQAPATLTRDNIQAQHPALFAALQAEFTAAGATAERERIQSVMAQQMAGHGALIQSLAFDGKTTGPEAAVQVLAAERAKLGRTAAQLADDAPAAAPAAATPAVPPQAAAQDMSLPVEARCKAAWETDAKLRGEFTSLEAFTAYARAEEAGKVRRLTTRTA
jgi:ClpP class serine protease